MSWNEMWANAATCKKAAPDELFVRGAEQHKAKAVCGACPVRAVPCGSQSGSVAAHSAVSSAATRAGSRTWTTARAPAAKVRPSSAGSSPAFTTRLGLGQWRKR